MAKSAFEMFAVFALFTIFLRMQLTHDIAELRAQGYLLMRMTNSGAPELDRLRENMEATFDAEDLLTRFSDEHKDAVSGEYNGRLFGRAIPWFAQAWMLGFILFYAVRGT